MLADYKKTWEKITFLRSFNNTDPRTGPDLLGKPAVGDENLVVHYDIKTSVQNLRYREQCE
jgi:hypothetical protein